MAFNQSLNNKTDTSLMSSYVQAVVGSMKSPKSKTIEDFHLCNYKFDFNLMKFPQLVNTSGGIILQHECLLRMWKPPKQRIREQRGLACFHLLISEDQSGPLNDVYKASLKTQMLFTFNGVSSQRALLSSDTQPSGVLLRLCQKARRTARE